MMQVSADELGSIRNNVHDKQIFLVIDESALSGIQYLNILVGSQESAKGSYLYDCPLLPCAQNIATALLKQLTMLLDLLKSRETLSIFV